MFICHSRKKFYLLKFTDLKSKNGVRVLWPYIVEHSEHYNGIDVVKLVEAMSSIRDVKIEKTDLELLIKRISDQDIQDFHFGVLYRLVKLVIGKIACVYVR